MINYLFHSYWSSSTILQDKFIKLLKKPQTNKKTNNNLKFPTEIPSPQFIVQDLTENFLLSIYYLKFLCAYICVTRPIKNGTS